MEELGWRRIDVACRAGVSEDVVRSLLTGRKLSRLHLGKLVAVADALGLYPSDLVPGLGRRGKTSDAVSLDRLRTLTTQDVRGPAAAAEAR